METGSKYYILTVIFYFDYLKENAGRKRVNIAGLTAMLRKAWHLGTWVPTIPRTDEWLTVPKLSADTIWS